MSYEIDRDKPSDVFIKARNKAGAHLQEMFEKNTGKIDENMISNGLRLISPT